jgi:hypothetical protein
VLHLTPERVSGVALALAAALLAFSSAARAESGPATASETPWETIGTAETATPDGASEPVLADTAPPSGTAERSGEASGPAIPLLVSAMFGGMGLAAARRKRCAPQPLEARSRRSLKSR